MKVTLPDGRGVVFLNLAFLYRDELEFNKRHGSETLLQKSWAADFTPADLFVTQRFRPQVPGLS
jgi:hypothetical protein